MSKQSIFVQHSHKLHKKEEKCIDKEIFNCLLKAKDNTILTRSKIAKEVGCSPTTASRHLKQLVNVKKRRGKYFYFVRWTKLGYKMERCGIEYQGVDHIYQEDVIMELSDLKACTQASAKEITSTTVFWGVQESFIDDFEMHFRNCFPKDWYTNLLVQDDGLYIILKEVQKKELSERRKKIVDFYNDVVHETERQHHEKILSCKQAHIDIKN